MTVEAVAGQVGGGGDTGREPSQQAVGLHLRSHPRGGRGWGGHLCPSPSAVWVLVSSVQPKWKTQ